MNILRKMSAGNYLKIKPYNYSVCLGFETQFRKFEEDFIDSYNVDYDYSSIMHYSPTAFAKRRGLVTIEPRPKRDVTFGQRDHLSNGDIRQANAMYGCDETDFMATTISTTSKQTTKPPTTTSARTKKVNLNFLMNSTKLPMIFQTTPTANK